jgi:hypothetical protein
MTFARAAGAEKQRILPLGDEGAGGQVEDQTAIDLRIEIEIEIVEGLLRVAEGGLLAPPLQEALAATGDSSETRHEIRSMGAMASAWAWRRRVSSTAAMPPSRNWRKARCNSIRFILVPPGFGFG